MTDIVVAVEKAVVAYLKATPAVTSVIPAGQLYTQQAPANPAKPFAKPGTQIAAPYTGHRRRRDIRFPIYIRADARRNAGKKVIETARDHMGRCVDAIVDALYRARLPVDGGTAQFILINDLRRMMDGEADTMEANIEFRVRVMTA